MKKGLTLTIVLLIVAAVLAVVGFVQKGDVQKKLEAAELKLTEQTEKAAGVDAAMAELETAKAGLASTEATLEITKTELQGKVDALTAELESAKAAGETAKAELQGKIDNLTAELETAKSGAAATLGETEAAKAELQTRVDALTVELDAAKAELETAKAGAQTQADALTAQAAALTAEVETVKAELETLKAAPAPMLPVVKHGLGMVTSVGSLLDATAEKPGAAQVNTTVCSVELDENNVILAVTWDVQQTKIQFSLEGKPVEVPAELLTKLEKGDAYGMKAASGIGKEWFEQIGAFGEYAVGKTVEEVLAIETFERDATHKFVPAGADLTASVTVTVGDYLASLEKAAANAK